MAHNDIAPTERPTNLRIYGTDSEVAASYLMTNKISEQGTETMADIALAR